MALTISDDFGNILINYNEKALFLVTDEPLRRPPAGPVFLVHRYTLERLYFSAR